MEASVWCTSNEETLVGASPVDLVRGYYDASDNIVVQAVYKPFASASHTYQSVSGGVKAYAPPKKSRPQCTHCHLIGHTKEKCYKLHGYPPGYVSKARQSHATHLNAASGAVDSSVSHDSLSVSQCQQLIAMLTTQLQAASSADLPSSSINLIMQGKILSYVNLFSSFDSKRYWIIDSGASRHVCAFKESFDSLCSIQGGSIMLPDNSTVMVEYSGTIRLSSKLVLYDVLFADFFSSLGIIHQFSCVETPQQNSVVERKHQHLLAVARALFFQSRVPIRFWGDFILTANFLINRLPTPVLGNKSPFEVLYSTTLVYQQLKVFGCLCFVSTLKAHCDKFSERALPGVFLGYVAGVKGYKVYILKTRSIVVSRNVIFHETMFPFHSITDIDTMVDPFSNVSLPQFSNTYVSYQDEFQANVDLPADETTHIQETSIEVIGENDLEISVEAAPVETAPVDNAQSISGIPARHDSTVVTSRIMPRRSVRATQKPNYLAQYYCNGALSPSCPYPIEDYVSTSLLSEPYKAFVSNIASTYEPTFFHQAVKFHVWRSAMDDEIHAMETLQTWSVVPLLEGKQAIDCKWVYRIKHKADGSIDRYKARLVAKGFTQIEGVHYTDTFSPVTKMTSFKILLALAACKQWHLLQLDVNNAFLNGILDEGVYMKLPLGYKHAGSDSSRLVCKLNKSIYGLKQASRQWFGTFSQVVLKYGFNQSPSDHSLFVKGTGDDFVALLVYVDDIILAGKNLELLQGVQLFLKEHFKLKELGELKYFLGFEIARNSTGISLSQRQYTLQLLEDSKSLAKKPADLPILSPHKLSKNEGELLTDPADYRRYSNAGNSRMVSSSQHSLYTPAQAYVVTSPAGSPMYSTAAYGSFLPPVSPNPGAQYNLSSHHSFFLGSSNFAASVPTFPPPAFVTSPSSVQTFSPPAAFVASPPTAFVPRSTAVVSPHTPMTGGSEVVWYPDSGATHHITNDRENLQSDAVYIGMHSLLMGNGAKVSITHVGHGELASSDRSLQLRGLLCVPDITKNLLSVSQFARDNNVYFEFYPHYCFVKDIQTKTPLLKGKLTVDGLYELRVMSPSSALPSDDVSAAVLGKSAQVYSTGLNNSGVSTAGLDMTVQACSTSKVIHPEEASSPIMVESGPLIVVSTRASGVSSATSPLVPESQSTRSSPVDLPVQAGSVLSSPQIDGGDIQSSSTQVPEYEAGLESDRNLVFNPVESNVGTEAVAYPNMQEEVDHEPSMVNVHPMVTRGKNGIRKPKVYQACLAQNDEEPCFDHC
ncbi:hypothetical protein GQ457_14G000950 [Hibiscus cannabinus]